MSPVTKTRLALALVLAVIALLAVVGDEARLLLRYERAFLPGPDVWRWLSGHLVHLTTGHAVLNAAGLALIYLLFAAQLSAWRWVLAFCCGVAAIDAGLWFFAPGIEWYVGLSGVLHALFFVGAFAEARKGLRAGWWLLAGLTAKIIWEQTLGPLPLTAGSAGGPVVVDAHMFGALGGALACGLIWAHDVWRPERLNELRTRDK